MGKVSGVIALALWLAACGNPYAAYAPCGAGVWCQTTSAPLEPRYCYRTLGKVDCFDRPRPDAANRLVGAHHAAIP